MGMFTSVTHPTTGEEIQFKCGWDDCDRYEVGDEVPVRYSRYAAGSGGIFDGAYAGLGNERDYWVVVAGGKIAAVEDLESEDETTAAYLEVKYSCKPPSLDNWSDELWAKRAKREEESRRRSRASRAEEYGLSEEEVMDMRWSRYLRSQLLGDGILRRVLPVEAVPSPATGDIPNAAFYNRVAGHNQPPP